MAEKHLMKKCEEARAMKNEVGKIIKAVVIGVIRIVCDEIEKR